MEAHPPQVLACPTWANVKYIMSKQIQEYPMEEHGHVGNNKQPHGFT